MDPRHDPRRIRERREAAREAREDRRAAKGRQWVGSLIMEVEGTLCAEALAGGNLDLCLLALVKDYLNRGLQASPLLREGVDRLLNGECFEPGDEREIVLDMLAGAVGLLSRSGKEFAYWLMAKRDDFLSFTERDGEWGKVGMMLDQALGRGVFSFRC